MSGRLIKAMFGGASLIIFLIGASAVLAQSPKKVTRTKTFKQHKLSDTVGIVGGEVITYYDFKGTLNNAIRQSGMDTVSDSEYSIFVNKTWEQLVNDIIIAKEIKKRHFNISRKESEEELREKTPDWVKADFSRADGTFDSIEFRKAMKNDTARKMLIGMERIWLEHEKLVKAVTPKQADVEERAQRFADWLVERKKHISIEDRRIAFGFY